MYVNRYQLFRCYSIIVQNGSIIQSSSKKSTSPLFDDLDIFRIEYSKTWWECDHCALFNVPCHYMKKLLKYLCEDYKY